MTAGNSASACGHVERKKHVLPSGLFSHLLFSCARCPLLPPPSAPACASLFSPMCAALCPACQAFDCAPPSLVRQPSPLLVDRKRRRSGGSCSSTGREGGSCSRLALLLVLGYAALLCSSSQLFRCSLVCSSVDFMGD
jgi:hypothetical protein